MDDTFLSIFRGFIYLFISKKIDLKRINKFSYLFVLLFILSPSIYSYVSVSQKDKRTDFPGKEIAYLVQNKWNQNFNNEIKIVIGMSGTLKFILPP